MYTKSVEDEEVDLQKEEVLGGFGVDYRDKKKYLYKYMYVRME